MNMHIKMYHKWLNWAYSNSCLCSCCISSITWSIYWQYFDITWCHRMYPSVLLNSMFSLCQIKISSFLYISLANNTSYLLIGMANFCRRLLNEHIHVLIHNYISKWIICMLFSKKTLYTCTGNNVCVLGQCSHLVNLVLHIM